MGITYSINVNVDKEAVEDFVGELGSVVEKIEEEKEERKIMNEKLHSTVDDCVQKYMNYRLLGCNDLFMFSGKKEKCNEMEYDLLQCTANYMKFLAEKH